MNVWNKALQNSKPMKMVLLTEKRLLELADLLEIKFENWKLIEILTAILYLEDVAKTKLTHVSVKNLLYSMRDALRLHDVYCMDRWEKEIKCFMTYHINQRIDKAEKPTKKKSANSPPNQVWLRMIKSLGAYNGESEIKWLRTAQALLGLVLSRSAGARLDELLRLKRSDIEPKITEDGTPYVSLCIRRGKSCPKGVIPVYYKCFPNTKNPELCPIKALIWYFDQFGDDLVKNDGDFVFPSSYDHKEFHLSGRAMTARWNKESRMLGLPKKHYCQAHSGHRVFVITACALKMTKEQILEATNWGSLKVLPMYVEGPTPDNYNNQLTKFTAKELDKKVGHMYDF